MSTFVVRPRSGPGPSESLTASNVIAVVAAALGRGVQGDLVAGKLTSAPVGAVELARGLGGVVGEVVDDAAVPVPGHVLQAGGATGVHVGHNCDGGRAALGEQRGDESGAELHF